MLRNAGQEFTLLINEKNELELVPYDQIMDVANGSREVQAFTFKRGKDLYAVYWHISSDKRLALPLKPGNLTLMEKLGQEIRIQSGQDRNNTILPVGNRRYIKTNKLTEDDLTSAFRNAKILD